MGAETMRVGVLGAGVVDCAVIARRPLDWHGIRGLAWKVLVRLPDGSVVEAIEHPGRPATFADPRVRPAA